MSEEKTNTGFLDKTLNRARQAWQRIADSEYDASAASMRPDLPEDDADRLVKQMHDCLEAKGGEVSARVRAAALGHVYMALDPSGKNEFLRIMAEDFDVDHEKVRKIASQLISEHNGGAKHIVEMQLRDLLDAPRIKLLTQFNALPEGVKFLVDLRADLLPLTKNNPAMKALDNDIKSLFSSWFDIGFLELRRITWDNSSAALLEKLIAYEAVHEIRSWDDLKNRLDSDRRCYAFFHPRMPEEPLIFVEVALVNGLADNVQSLLDENAPVQDSTKADTAIFYSISNAQKGLAGISFGNFLIKRVVEHLSHEFPTIKTFATLSPIPGFLAWLEKALSEGEKGVLSVAEHKSLNALGESGRGAKGKLMDLLSSGDWTENPQTLEILKTPMMRICARYLTQVKRHEKTTMDPVAHFHLSNGARMESLNWMGDLSTKGMKQSAGLMINYLYKHGDIEKNHENYKAKGTVPMSSSIRSLAKK
ncbi:MAG: malonyl-CoA decarboxylase [Rhodospirillales bacterium]|jgi:malonyl-CoA decarboxylase|nr:malonyl-CoA decarboxylase [Rhodospirillales bacterium]